MVDQSNRGRAAGLYQSGFLIGGMLGPVFGGFLTERSLRLPFYTYAITLLVAGSIGAVFLQAARLRPLTSDVPVPATGDAGGDTAGSEQLGAERAGATSPGDLTLRCGVPPGAVPGGTHGQLRDRLRVVRCAGEPDPAVRARRARRDREVDGDRPAVLVDRADAHAGHVRPIRRQPGAATGHVRRLPARRCRVPRPRAGRGVAGVLGLHGRQGAAASFLATGPVAVVGDIMRERSGKVVAVFSMSSDLGAISGPIVAGVLADQLSYGPAFAVCAVVMATGVIAAARMPETFARVTAAST